MNSAIYNIIYSKLTRWLTPSVLKQAKFLSWLNIIVSPVITIYNDLIRFRFQKLYELGITPQVVYLQKLLNDRFDFVARRITIVDSIEHDVLYIYTDAELKPVYIKTDGEAAPTFIYTDAEIGIVPNDFVVKVPAAVVFNMNEMISLLKQFKLSSKQFTIQII